jgi:hypothetical protein
MYYQPTISEYICGGRFLSIKYHLSIPVLYMVGHRSFRFLKDTIVSDSLLQFIQYVWIERKMFAFIEKH